jgi:hypothetical protein
MSIEFLVLFLLAAGFIAAPFADFSVPARRPRIASTVLLITVFSVLGSFGFAFDRGYLPPDAWFACGIFVLTGVGICALAYWRRQLRGALVLAGTLVLAIVGLHFFPRDFIRTCQRACSRIHGGMDVNQVRSVVLSEFEKSSDYRVVEDGGRTVLANGESSLMFQLRPLYAQLSPETLQVIFVDGRASKVWTSAVVSPMSPLFILELGAAFVLCTICINRLCPSGREAVALVQQIDFDAIKGRSRSTWEGHFAGQKRGALRKRTLMACSRQKIRQLAYFDSRPVPTTREPEEEP